MSVFDWAHRHWIMTIVIVIWALALTTVITIKVFFAPVAIPTGTAGAFTTLFALPTIATGLWKWRNKYADSRTKSSDEDSSNG